ncbi:MAG: diguanylate cyclase/phosphodiesterase with sensor(s) [Defluviitaleaceae bacterium]|nr:diguanylate cyclase/phosphodiesterase with sensor(s) [Defluviitaleaceae bacterium]
MKLFKILKSQFGGRAKDNIDYYKQNNYKINPLLEAIKVTIIYGFVGELWILLSDDFSRKISGNLDMYQEIQTYKGGIYVFLTMSLIFFLVFNKMSLLKKAFTEITKNYYELKLKNQELVKLDQELRKQVEELEKHRNALAISEQRLELAIEGSENGIWDWDLEKNIFYISPKWKTYLGYEVDEIDDTHEAWRDLLHPDDKNKGISKFYAYIQSPKGSYEHVNRVRCKDGSYKWILTRAKAIKSEDGKVIRVAGSLIDITKVKRLEEKMQKLAYHDQLTKLPNRFLFEERIKTVLNESKAAKRKFALLYMDIDNFKNVNDTLGHSSGDLLIRYIASILRYQIKEPNFVARLGGDEFAIILCDIQNKQDIVNKVQGLLKSLRRPWILENQEFYISVSIGIAIYPEHGDDLSLLLKNADIAMYFVKNNLKDNYCFYSLELQNKSIEQIKMINYIRHAIDNNEFYLLYQPIIDLKNGNLIGAEVLIRWDHPKLGIISPMKFIPLAEETGLIYDIEKWVLKTALMQKKEWLEKNYPNLKISINISGKRITSAGIINEIRELLHETQLKADEIQLEVTETAVMKNLETSMEILNEIRNMGIHIALDDFGTGYSSLTYLEKLPIDLVKLDREFIKNISIENNDRLILEHIIKLIQELNLKVAVEGVELQEQVAILKNNDCDYGQGDLFGKPVSKEEFEKLMLSNQSFYKIP